LLPSKGCGNKVIAKNEINEKKIEFKDAGASKLTLLSAQLFPSAQQIRYESRSAEVQKARE
jgi:hypothetical protein